MIIWVVNLIANNPSFMDGSVIAFAYGGSSNNYVWSNGVTTSFNFNVGIEHTLFMFPITKVILSQRPSP